MYQGSLAEIFVPYQDPDANWFYRTYMDAGEFGFGLLASPLALGPRRARERGAARRASWRRRFPTRRVPVVPLPLPQVIGIFERLTGNPAWRHFELFAGRRLRGPRRGRARRAQHRPARQLRLPGRLGLQPERRHPRRGRADRASTRRRPSQRDARGARRGAGHALRRAGRRRAGRAQPQPPLQLPARPRHRRPATTASCWASSSDGQRCRPAQERLGGRGQAHRPREGRPARRTAKPSGRSSIRTARNARGYNTGYMVESHSDAEPLLKKADYQRAGFIGHPLWITRYDPTSATPPATRRTRIPAKPGMPRLPAGQRKPRQHRHRPLADGRPPSRDGAEDFPVLSLERCRSS